MSDEHERTKPPLPVRPPRPHPQGFILCLTDTERAELREKVRVVNKRSESRPK